MINLTSSNSLEKLSKKMTLNICQETSDDPAAVLSRRHCIVVPNRTMQYWFQHHFLFDQETGDRRVLANMEYPLLHEFVNNWLHQMTEPDEKRNPNAHPFSISSMQWRIFSLLRNGEILGREPFEPLRKYIETVGDDQTAQDKRRFNLSGQLSHLFDQYQVYRPEMVLGWENGSNVPAEDGNLLWQPELWRQLTQGELRDKTYLSAFRRMTEKLSECDIKSPYPAIHIFGVSMMPRVYTVFFDLLSNLIPTHFYLFNPAKEDWFGSMTQREVERARLQGQLDDESLLDFSNPLLSAMGRGCRDLLSDVLDMTEGDHEDDFKEFSGNTVLQAIQKGITDDAAPVTPDTPIKDDSVQVHICHSPMREVEVLRDHLLRWFTEDPDLQPRQVQVQVSDMTLYAPYIDAVFSTLHKDAAETIPYAIADRVAVGESVVGEAFNRLLNLADSRFSAPDVVDLLQCESVYSAFGFSESDLELVTSLVSTSGIRWGRDSKHREESVGVSFTERTTWQHGLDRLMLGYAMTQDNTLADKDLPLPCDLVEGGEAEVLGHLVRFVDCLQHTAAESSAVKTSEEWAIHLDNMIETFFARTKENYKDIASLRLVVRELRTSTTAAGFDGKIPISIIRDFIAGRLSNSLGGADLVRNAVVFGSLRAGSTASRTIICMLGMGDGQFPRSDNRPAYDLFRKTRHRGDPSLRVEDRMAFLEAIMAAEKRLYISYVGRTVKENESIPPATVLAELMEYAQSVAGADGVVLREHKLQPFNPVYFDGSDGFFSYDKSNCKAARGIIARKSAGTSVAGEAESHKSEEPPFEKAQPIRVELDQLVRFFKNPAKFFYNQVLKAWLEVPDEERLPQEEEFEPGGLSGYTVNDAILAAIRDEKDKGEVYEFLCESGIVPLGRWGECWFAEQWDTIAEILEKDVDGHGTIRDLITRQINFTVENTDVVVGEGQLVAGRITCTDPDFADMVVVDYRCVSSKARDKLVSWIHHVFACAAGQGETRYCILGKEVDKVNMTRMSPVEQSEAVKLLAVFVDLYVQGHGSPLPFAPATSFAYIDGREKAKVSEDIPEDQQNAARLEKGMAAAKGEWFDDPNNAHSFKDDLDSYFRQAFGVDGPMAKAGFVEAASRVLDPMFRESTKEKKI